MPGPAVAGAASPGCVSRLPRRPAGSLAHGDAPCHAVKPSGVWLRGKNFAQSVLARGESSPRIRLQEGEVSQSLAKVRKFSQNLAMGGGGVLLKCGCGRKILTEFSSGENVLPECDYKGKKFSQNKATGRKVLPESGCEGGKFWSQVMEGKVLLESGYKGKKFSQSQVMGEEEVLLESGCGEKNFSLGTSNTRGLNSQLDTSMSKGRSVPVLWRGNVLDAQIISPSCSWYVVRGRLTAWK